MGITVSIDDPLIRDLVAVRCHTLDLQCAPTEDGLIVTRTARDEGDTSVVHARIVVVPSIDAEALEQCGQDGVVGVLTHGSRAELLDLALTADPADGVVVDPGIASRLARRMVRAEPLGANRGLTEREQEILSLMADGLALKQIADRLDITTKTVENHATKVYAKLGVRNRREAAALAQADPTANP